MYSDYSGFSPVSSVGWFTPGNTFELTATIFQLIIGGTGISGYVSVVNAVRPNNIGIGIWNKQRAVAIESFKSDVKAMKKASNILAAVTVAVQVGSGIYTDIDRGYSVDRIVSNALVNTAVYSATTIGLAKLGGFVGSFVPIPIVGTVAQER